MIEKITNDKISLTLPTVFGEELTFLEFCGKMRSKLNECIGVVNKNSSDIQQNTSAIQQNTTNIQQNTTNISKNELSIAEIHAAFNILRTDFLKQKAEALFAPVILNVDPHSFGADINASVYIRIGRISYNVLGCLYAKVNISFSGETAAKTLKILSVQFGKRSVISLGVPTPTFTANTDVINIPIYLVGSNEIPVGTSNIAITGLNFFGSSEDISDISSAIDLENIPTGKDILCDSLTFTSPGGGEGDPKFVYTLKISEGNMDIFTTGVGTPAITERSHIDIDFSSTISASNIYDQFLCVGGVYDDDSISSISENGVSLGAALINYTEYTDNNRVCTARISIKNINDGGSNFIIKPTGLGIQPTPFGKFSQTSLTFDMFN